VDTFIDELRWEEQDSAKRDKIRELKLTSDVTGVDPITIRQSLIPSSLRPLSSQDEVEWEEGRELECIDSATGQETQLAVLGTTERALYTVQSIQNVLHYDAL
jgi:hypothetical protein